MTGQDTIILGLIAICMGLWIYVMVSLASRRAKINARIREIQNELLEESERQAMENLNRLNKEAQDGKFN